jgi:hypothetical protein
VSEEIPYYSPEAKQEPETFKTIHENYKHLTTLNAGSILLIGTFLKDIFPAPEQISLVTKVLIAGAFLLFAISLVSSVWFMVIWANRYFLIYPIRRSAQGMQREAPFSGLQTRAAWGFLLGLICFSLAVLMELF